MYTDQEQGEMRREHSGASAQRPVLVAHAGDFGRRALAPTFGRIDLAGLIARDGALL